MFKNISDLKRIMLVMNEMAISQGSIVDRIDFNI